MSIIFGSPHGLKHLLLLTVVLNNCEYWCGSSVAAITFVYVIVISSLSPNENSAINPLTLPVFHEHVSYLYNVINNDYCLKVI